MALRKLVTLGRVARSSLPRKKIRSTQFNTHPSTAEQQLFRLSSNMAGELEKLKEKACSVIDSYKEELHSLSRHIWGNPELCYEEFEAHQYLTNFLEHHGFEVTRHHTLETAFRASSPKSDKGLKVGIMCEYDALPEIGHACGHNLIAEAAVAAGLGVKEVLESSPGLGQVVVLGTPAEEGGGGKVKMIENGCFEEFDFCMMVHPGPEASATAVMLAMVVCYVTFHGKAAHAAAYPWEGINALDAAVMCYNSISVLRQQMKPTWRIHGIITEGGVKPNIIPERSQLMFIIRAPNKKELKQLSAKAEACMKSAATATGCTVDVKYEMSYSDVITNSVLAQLYDTNGKNVGMENLLPQKASGSTDMGNVSYVKPSIHPYFYVSQKVASHTRSFQEVAGTDAAQVETLKAGKAMALTALDVFCNPEMISEINEDFQKSLQMNS